MTQDEALQILKTGANVFLTGEPGSGKSYAAARYVSYLRRENIPVSITASTGIAAAQIGGTTIHAWSGIGTRSRISRSDLDSIAKNRRVTDRIKKARVLIVDEVSMLSGQTLTAVSQVCQFVRKRQCRPSAACKLCSWATSSSFRRSSAATSAPAQKWTARTKRTTRPSPMRRGPGATSIPASAI